jgi:hypothetical protein
MKKISIVQFEPIIGGESTLCESLSNLLSSCYDIKIYHPCQIIDSKLRISKLWHAVNNGKFVPYSYLKTICDNSDYTIFLNSIHVSTHTPYSLMRELIVAFSTITDSNLIFYEHGLHTWKQCDYLTLFSILEHQNSIRVLTNTIEGKAIYEKYRIKSFLCRQPFLPKSSVVEKNDTDIVNICFNSRFSLNKKVDKVVNYFHEFLNDSDMRFSLNFRESGLESENLISLKKIIIDSKNGKLERYTTSSQDIYNKQDFCLFFGYDDRQEVGKLEYSLLEAFHYSIPVIAHPSWIRNFKYTEYGFDKEFIDKCFIPLDPYTFKDIVANPQNYRHTIENAKLLLEDFSATKILNRIKTCLETCLEDI